MGIPDEVWVAEDMDGELFVVRDEESAAAFGGAVLFKRWVKEEVVKDTGRYSNQLPSTVEGCDLAIEMYVDMARDSRGRSYLFHVEERADGSLLWEGRDGKAHMVNKDQVKVMIKSGVKENDFQRMARVSAMKYVTMLKKHREEIARADEVPF